MIYQVKDKFGNIRFSAEIEAFEADSAPYKLGKAILWGIANKQDLTNCDLSGAWISGEHLECCNFSDSLFIGANLSSSFLNGSILKGCNFINANLTGTCLIDADCKGAVFKGCDLQNTEMTNTIMEHCNLNGCLIDCKMLKGTKLRGANMLHGACINGTMQYRPPVQVIEPFLLGCNVWDGHIQIECEFRSIAEWEECDTRDFIQMRGKDIVKWASVWRPILIEMARATGRDEYELRMEKVNG